MSFEYILGYFSQVIYLGKTHRTGSVFKLNMRSEANLINDQGEVLLQSLLQNPSVLKYGILA